MLKDEKIMLIVGRWQSARASRAIFHRTFTSSHPVCLPVNLSAQYIPTCRRDEIAAEGLESVKVLLQGGYIRQSSSGFFTILPLGLRLLRKIEGLVDEELQKVGE